jgi:nickel-dependent lactate racemase
MIVNILRILAGVGVIVVLDGCGAGGDLLSGSMGVSPAVQAACTGVMDNAEILAELAAARVDQVNGYTKAEELTIATQACSSQAIWNGASVEACSQCKRAILDAVYGP